MPTILDPFQEKALHLIAENRSVFVSAPTGAGKTVIAEAAIRKALTERKTVIYTAPIKALSNQKYRDFRKEFGDHNVGILTGDVSINPEGSILIMTTEIYRNSLFEESDRFKNIGWVIFDEIHYLDDIERGTVWEEAVLFTPAEISILALSATVPNIRALAEWLSSIHPRQVEVIEEAHRPVPLHFFFQCQGRMMDSLKELKKHGYLNRDFVKWNRHERRRGHQTMRARPNRLDHLMEHLLQEKRLPAVYFAFGRRRTEYLASEAAPRFDLLTSSERKAIITLYQELLDRYDLQQESSAQDMLPLVERGIAYHHAGMLPTLKEVVEQLFTSRLIKVIFTTETFALGINMPARTVIFDELEKFYGTGFRKLSTRDFYQMAGRAGRRGMDVEGFVYLRVNPHDVSHEDVVRMIHGQPEKIRSQLNTAYATLLNLYRKLGKRLMDIYPQTFHYFQASHKHQEDARGLIQRKLTMLREMDYLNDEGLTVKGEFASSVFGYELFAAEMQQDLVFENLQDTQLSVLLSALIFEPRKGDHLPRLQEHHKKLQRLGEHYARFIYNKELKYRITPHTKMPHFNLAPVVEAWVQGADFDSLFRLTRVDEGELVRHFRMIIQLLREISHASHVSERLRQTADKARGRINRGVVDAERQLRV